MEGTYTSEVEGTLKCKSEKQRPLYTTQGGLCAHGSCTLIQHVHVSVMVNQIQLLVGNQLEHRTAMSADTITATTGILIKGNKRKS